MSERRLVLVVYGTRPEAIKLAPVIAELRRCPDIDVCVAVTGQHREMVHQVHEVFGIIPDHDLDICRPRQSLVDVSTRALTGLTDLLRRERPDVVIVQGDTTTAFVGALAAYYEQVPVVHVEAGLRAGARRDPFPEEVNRRLIAQVADLHLAPTLQAAENLKAEGLPAADIVVTGNTVIDALHSTARLAVAYSDPELAAFVPRFAAMVLVTTHRRESWGTPMARIASAIASLARMEPGVGFVVPAHPNPAVRDVLLPPLEGLANVLVVEPVPYGEFCRLLSESSVVLTDSGGVQEEAPSLGKPVLVMRETTERPEGIDAGSARLVGTHHDAIIREVRALLDHPRSDLGVPTTSPYGDGRAAVRSVAAVRALLGLGHRLPDFSLVGSPAITDKRRGDAA